MTHSLDLKPFKCRSCGCVIAMTDGKTICIGESDKPVDFDPTHLGFPCPYCKTQVHWFRDGYENSLRRRRFVV